jgi:hypothetical protein
MKTHWRINLFLYSSALAACACAGCSHSQTIRGSAAPPATQQTRIQAILNDPNVPASIKQRLLAGGPHSNQVQ